MSKHKLAGYAIKGDGTQETAERIKKVFEADGVENKAGYNLIDNGYFFIDKYCGDLEWSDCKEGNDLIPLTEAEALVFGELKAGMMVIGWAINRDGVDYHEVPWEIGTIWYRGDLGGITFVSPKSNPNHNCSINSVRRATITDFLRTLPEDIAERALRQVDERFDHYNEYPANLKYAIEVAFDWGCSTEGSIFWLHVKKGNYDRARELLRPATDENRVGKWWKHEDGSIIFGVEYDEEGNLHGYGFDAEEHFNWFHYEGNTHYWPCCNKKQLRTLTPADPKEVKRMLVKEALKKYKVGDVVVDVYDGETEEIGGDLKVKVDLQDASGDYTVWQYGYACLFSNGKWATIIDSEPSPDTEQADPMCDSELSSSDKPNTDKFPRMMWVWDIDAEDVKIKNIVDYDPDDPFHWHGEGHPEMKTDRYINASDTHPVTGQPATEKSVVEQIREVVENGIMADSWKLSEIKSILDK